MRQQTLFAQTYRDVPSEAEVISHQLLLRAGFIRQIAAGIYTYLPLGLRVLRKIEKIIRQEMDEAGAQELLMPTMQPVQLWKESGRYSLYGPELIRLQDRHEREFALGPTHEEVVTSLVRNEINSYRKLPVTLYQIQTKFRDERRPRYGLLRGREFLMKDAYSFDRDWEGLDLSYNQMFKAYKLIFDRCGLNYRAVEADAGSIGGEGGTHEFMALADIGEDTIVSCTQCHYAANLEKAESRFNADANHDSHSSQSPEKFHTPRIRTIDQLVEVLKLEKKKIIKTMIYKADDKVIAVLIRGDHEVNELKVKNYLNAEYIEIADAETVELTTGAPSGFAGPIGLTIPIYVDLAITTDCHWIAGANVEDYHIRDIVPGRDFPMNLTGDFRNVVEGEACLRCNTGTLSFDRGIEVGHVFKLGTKYSDSLGATFLDHAGINQPLIMGCYGIGVSRILSAVIEQNKDENGMIWPMAIAPFQVHLIPVSMDDEVQRQLTEQLYEKFKATGIEVLLDDRDERPGVKFKDSDLIGIPIRIVIGKLAGEGFVEFKQRGQEDKMTLDAQEAYNKVKLLVGMV